MAGDPSPVRPPREAIAWVERETGGRAASVRRMTGGVASVVHRVRIETSGDQFRDVVLRRWLRDDWGDPTEFVRHEVEVLEALAATDLAPSVPRLVAASPTGTDVGGRPALVMDRLPGRVHLRPRNEERWLRQLAATAARVHDLKVTTARPFESWFKFEELTVPDDAARPDIWRAAHRTMEEKPAPYTERFVHRDYQHFNLLWVGERLTGILDWGSACAGPADVDLGHCRLNLAVLFSAAWADDFLAMYEAEAGRTVDPYWDLRELLVYAGWWHGLIPRQVAGRRPVDVAGMTARVESVIEGALKRLG